MRIGTGLDAHAFGDDGSGPLRLGGVVLEGQRGLIGHSDADVVAHAVADALLGATGLGDIGALFPDTDPALRGADSLSMLTEVAARVHLAGWQPVNVDCVVVLDSPKLAPHRDEMERRLSEAVGAPVTVKGKRTEGGLASGEGVMCWAVALVDRAR